MIERKVRLGEVVEILSGFAFDSASFSKECGIPLIRIRDVKRGATETFFTGSFDNKFLVRNGDLIIGMDGEFNREVWGGGDALLNQRVCKITPNKDQLDLRYLYHLLPKHLKKIEDETPFVTVKHLSAKALNGISFVLPPLPEQKRIAEILDKADAIRRKRELAISKLDQLAQSVFVEMFGDPETNSKGWAVERLDALTDSNDTINYGVVQPGDHVEAGVPLVRVGNLVDNQLQASFLKRIDANIESAYQRSRLKGNEVLVSCVGSIGVVRLANAGMKGFNIARAVARIPVGPSINRTFLASYLKTRRVQRYFTSELRTVTQPTLNIKQICETLILCPSMDLQEKFESRVQTIEEMQHLFCASNEKLKETSNSIQNELFGLA